MRFLRKDLVGVTAYLEGLEKSYVIKLNLSTTGAKASKSSWRNIPSTFLCKLYKAFILAEHLMIISRARLFKASLA